MTDIWLNAYFNETHGAVALLAEAQLAEARLLREQLPKQTFEEGVSVAARRRGSGQVPDIERVDGRIVVASTARTTGACSRRWRRKLRRSGPGLRGHSERPDGLDKVVLVPALRPIGARGLGTGER